MKECTRRDILVAFKLHKVRGRQKIHFRKISFTKRTEQERQKKIKLRNESSEVVVEADYICHTSYSAFISRVRQTQAAFIQYTARRTVQVYAQQTSSFIFFLIVARRFFIFNV